MRSVFVVALVACVSATTLMDHPTAGKVTQSQFGSTVLAELESKLQTGSPLDELLSILNDIRGRLTAAAAVDAAEQADDTAFCEHENNTLNTDITLENSAIASAQATISAQTAEIARLTEVIAGLDAVIATTEQDIADNEKEQAERIAVREQEHETFITNDRDTDICINAIAEIQAMDLDQLANGKNGYGGQQDDASDYQAGVRMTALLQKVAGKVNNEHVVSLLQIAALSSAAMGNDDVDRMIALLNRLASELADYKVELKNDEDEQLRLHQNAMADLKNVNTNLTAQLFQYNNEREDAGVAKDKALATKAAAEIELKDHTATRDALVTNQQDLTDGCNARAASHVLRQDQRKAEHETLNEIEKTLTTKLSKHFQEGGHITARTADISSA